ncbi:lysozyme family protein [Virgibacillus xinjiangensis]|uniref:Lysozyme family protein n=1 Tax=Virgibacillus xinjiangensis TaxID=393090 RepID=A0ABV7CXW9_9BACI
MKRNIIRACKQTGGVVLLLCSLFLVLSYVSREQPVTETSQGPEISEEVYQYRPLVEKYAEHYEVGDHVNVILAIMMQESGGRGNDPMQSSESYCGERGCIEDPELSIQQGVRHFASVLAEADGDLPLAVQSYNFGRGFISYMEEAGQEYSQEAAIAFSQEMFQQVPNPEDYRCLREGAEEIGACYGDIYYVPSVLAYRNVLASE